MFTELLAESEFPAQGYFFIIVMVFSFLKWLFGKLTNKDEGEKPESLGSIFEQFIQQRDQVTPPPIQLTRAERTRITSVPPVHQQAKSQPPSSQFSSVDIEKERIAKIKRSQTPMNSAIQAKVVVENDNTAIRKKFRSKDGLRQAIIARQILGPPKALSGEKF